MATNANELSRHSFDGAGYPSFLVPWPDFTFPAAAGVNPGGWSQPVVDGHGHGMPSRAVGGVTWRARSALAQSRTAYQVDLWAKWSNAGFAGRREVGLVARYYSAQDVLVCRVRSMGTGNPELRLFKVLGGVETQLGATYTGAGLSATQLNAGLTWRVRVEDLAGGDTSVKCYLAPTGATGKGTLVLTWQGDLGLLRGALPVGVELRDQVFTTDVLVDELVTWDLADEWNPSGPPPSPGAGWQVLIGTQLYSLRELAELTPPVYLESVQQGYGPKGNAMRLRVGGDYRMGTLLHPGQYVEALHDGAVRFRGWVADGELVGSPQESQAWNAWDGAWNARGVFLLTDRNLPHHLFNVTDTQADEYDPDVQGWTLGHIGTFLFDRYLEQLRAVGAAPPDGLPYVSSEWAALTAVVPDVSLSGTFPAALESLLRFVAHRYQLLFDCADRVWHLRDVTGATDETVECTAEWVLFKVQPDRDKSNTYVDWVGVAQEEDVNLELSTEDGTLKPAWTTEQEDKYGKSKRNRTSAVGHIVGAGMAVLDGVNRPYFDLAAGLLDTDDFRGGIAGVEGDAFPRFVVKNTATRVWMSAPAWGAVPPPGSSFYLSLVDPKAAAELSAAGVGRGFVLFPPVEICGYPSAAFAGLKLNGFCGTATAYATGLDGKQTWSEKYAFTVRVPSPAQQAAGFCDTTLTLAEKPKPPMGLINFFPPKGGSPPKGVCEPGPQNQPAQTPLVHVKVSIPALKQKAPRFRVPAVGYRGHAYAENPAAWDGGGAPTPDDWQVTQGYQVQDPDFTDAATQQAGLELAAADVLAVKGEKAYLFQVELLTPWRSIPGAPPVTGEANSSRWAGLGKRVKVTSAKRPTGLEATPALVVFRVTWDVQGNRTLLEAGTSSGWLTANGVDVAAAYAQGRLLKRMQGELKRAVEAVNEMVNKDLARIGTQPGGPSDACEVNITNQQNRRTVTVEKDDADKVQNITHLAGRLGVLEQLVIGQEDDHPGAPIQVPGLSGPESQLVVDDGAVLRSPADYRVPFQGPALTPNADRGRYGGMTGTENPDSGRAPDTLARRGRLVFQKAQDAAGNRDGGPGPEVASTDSKGNPTGGFVPFTSPLVLPGGRAKLSMARAGSLVAQLVAQTQELALGLGRVQDQVTNEILQAGQAHVLYPDGVPAGLLESMRAPGLLGQFQLVPSSVTDPGGPVWAGPMNMDGVDAGLFWRVRAPEGIMLRVQAAAWGTGTNGGAWSWWTGGPGGAMQFLAAGSIIHKQAHSGDFQVDPRLPSSPSLIAADPTHPFGVSGKVWQFSGVAMSGLVSTIPAPEHTVGVPVFWATLKESPSVVLPANRTYQFRIDHAYQASPPTPIVVGPVKNGVTTDGTGTGTGQFKQPGGAVPPGLRVPSDSVVSTMTGTVPPGPNNGPVLVGAGYEIARVEGGYLVRLKEAGKVAEAWQTNHKALRERGVVVDAWALELGKVLSENPRGLDSWNPELNPPLILTDEGGGSDAWVVFV